MSTSLTSTVRHLPPVLYRLLSLSLLPLSPFSLFSRVPATMATTAGGVAENLLDFSHIDASTQQHLQSVYGCVFQRAPLSLSLPLCVWQSPASALGATEHILTLRLCGCAMCSARPSRRKRETKQNKPGYRFSLLFSSVCVCVCVCVLCDAFLRRSVDYRLRRCAPVPLDCEREREAQRSVTWSHLIFQHFRSCAISLPLSLSALSLCRCLTRVLIITANRLILPLRAVVSAVALLLYRH